jgi:hypothetical protein
MLFIVEIEHDMLQPFIVKNDIGSLYEFFRLAKKMRKREICKTLMILRILKKINGELGQIDELIRLDFARFIQKIDKPAQTYAKNKNHEENCLKSHFYPLPSPSLLE